MPADEYPNTLPKRLLTPAQIFRRFLAAVVYFGVFIAVCLFGISRLGGESGGFLQGLLTLGMLAGCGVSAMLAHHVVAGRGLERNDPRCCLHCGYDCRETPERCPECGRHPRG